MTKNPKRWKNAVFFGVSGEAVFSGGDAKAILDLMSRQCRAMRSAYMGRKKGLGGIELAKHLKDLGHGKIGVRYLTSAISQAEQLPIDRKVVFGGKDNWNRLIRGEISKDQWHQKRNNRLYARGDRSKSGNPLIRVDNNGEIEVLVPAAKGVRGTWIRGIVKMFNPMPPEAKMCYNVRLVHTKGRKFQVEVAWKSEIAEVETTEGMIGVDTNPDLLAAVELNGDGNPVGREGVSLPRVMFAKTEKREADIFLAAKEIVSIAKTKKKRLAIESLNFGRGKKRPKGKARNRRFNRMRGNFAYRKLLAAINRRAHKEGVPVTEVSPGYTSVLGIAKFSKSHNMNRHSAAAMVIGRRAMGMTKERQNFEVHLIEKTGRRRSGPRPAGKPSEFTSVDSGTPSGGVKRPVRVRLKPASWDCLSERYLRGTGCPLVASRDKTGRGNQNGRDSRPAGQKRVEDPPHDPVISAASAGLPVAIMGMGPLGRVLTKTLEFESYIPTLA